MFIFSLLQIKTGQFDAYTTVQGISVDDCSDIVDFCDAEGANVFDAYLIDLDGSLAHHETSSVSTPSTLVSHQPDMLHFIDPWDCTTNRARCYSYCNTCFRSVRYEIDPADTEKYALQVCKRNSGGGCIEIPGYRRTDDMHLSSEHRVFLAHLPPGEYTAVFLDDRSTETWPSFVYVRFEDALCPTAFPDGAVELNFPPIQPGSDECNRLVKNGNFESGTDHWLHRFGGLQLVSLAGVDGSQALAGGGLDDTATLVQHIDSRCMDYEKGRFYRLRADVKLTLADGTAFRCNPRRMDCPEIGLADDSGYITVAVVDRDVSAEGFQFAEGFIDIDDRLASATKVFVYIKSNVDQTLLHIDNVSMRLVPDEYKFCKNVILNSHMDLDSRDLWDIDGAGSLRIVEGPISASTTITTDMSMRFSKRKHSTDALLYTGWREIEYQCFKKGSSWMLVAKLQLVSAVTGLGVSCDENCPAVRLSIKDASGARIFLEKYREYVVSAWKEDDFNVLKTSFTLPNLGWDGTVSKINLDIRDFAPEYDLLVGNIAMKLDL